MTWSKRKVVETGLPWIIPAVMVLGWILVSEFALIPGYLLPKPREILSTAYNYLFQQPGQAPYAGRFWSDAQASLIRVGSGFGLATVLGLPLGLISGRLPFAQKLMSSFVNGLRSVPGICWLPIALVWFGIGLKTTIFLVALAAFFPIYINTAASARQISPILLQSGAMMGVTRLRGVFAVLLPGIMPDLMTGLRLGLGISWAYLVLGELTGVPDGLGAVIMDARMLGRIDMIILGIIIIAIIGRLSDKLLMFTLRFFFRSARRMG
ncbi:MAG: ABC transporter permease [Deltaproteobacteria bacterium]|nr:ABC transporter permease [Deltaproteobacteria bacterium]